MADLFAETDNPKPWHRQRLVGGDGKPHIESAQAHSALRIYLEMGDSRSVIGVARQLSKSRALCSRWSSQWKWKERARLYDIHVDQEVSAEFIKERKAMSRRLARLSLMGQNCITLEFARLQQELASQSARLKPQELARLLEVVARLEIAVRGKPTVEDAPTAINVIISTREKPRYETERPEDKDDDDSFYRRKPN